MMQKISAEFIGTAVLVMGGLGVALLGNAPGMLAVSLAFGLIYMAMIYVTAWFSGGHLNPAVSIGMVIAKRMDIKDAFMYIIAQVLGGMAGAAMVYLIASGKAGFEIGSFAANGFGDHSPMGYDQQAAFIAEMALTGVLMFVILCVTSCDSMKTMGPLVIGLTFVVLSMVAMSVTGAGLNPARSTASAFMAKGWAMDQLWLFWVAPGIGGILGAAVHNWLCNCCCGDDAACKTKK